MRKMTRSTRLKFVIGVEEANTASRIPASIPTRIESSRCWSFVAANYTTVRSTFFAGLFLSVASPDGRKSLASGSGKAILERGACWFPGILACQAPGQHRFRRHVQVRTPRRSLR